MANQQILIVDDSPADRALYRRLLEQGGSFDIVEAELGEEGLAHCLATRPACVLLDYRLPDLDGLEFLAALPPAEGADAIPVVFLTGAGNERLVAEAMRAGAADYLPKSGLTASALCRAVNNAIDRHQLRASIHRHGHLLEESYAALARKHAEIHRFYHTLSHELKTPLTSAREFVAIVRDGIAGPVNDTQREYLDIARQSCDQMTRMLNDLLDATRLETGKLQLEFHLDDLAAVAAEALAAFALRAQGLGTGLHLTQAAALPPLRMDRQRVLQVFLNLLDNALKFTPPGGTISVALDRDPGRPEAAQIRVADTGCGIAPEHLQHIFERLYQVQAGDMDTKGGIGLGLTLCREIVERHGGTITAQSTPGVGTTFIFTLPIAGPTAAVEAAAPHRL